jgi:hypothetical protein
MPGKQMHFDPWVLLAVLTDATSKVGIAWADPLGGCAITRTAIPAAPSDNLLITFESSCPRIISNRHVDRHVTEYRGRLVVLGFQLVRRRK